MVFAMTTREKIIVGVMCLTVVYGAWELLSGGSRKPRSTAAPTVVNQKENLHKFVADIAGQLGEDPAGRSARYVAAKSQEPWGKDPFIDSILPLKKQLEQAPSEVGEQASDFAAGGFTFSGFLQVGPTRMAIINGLEYAVGETLGISDYVIKKISPKEVIIGKMNGSETIVVPLRDIDPQPAAPTQEAWN